MKKPENIQAEMESIFKTEIMKIQLPDYVVKYLTDLTDTSSVENGDLDYSEFLAGHISEEIGITLEKLHENFKSFIMDACTQYVWHSCGADEAIFQNFDLILGKVWVNKQYENDYNPVHTHTGLIAGVTYLKVPQQVNFEDGSGCIDFISERNKYGSLDFNGNKRIAPKVGELYIFPAWLMHTVYPFQGEGERRSFAFNVYNQAIF